MSGLKRGGALKRRISARTYRATHYYLPGFDFGGNIFTVLATNGLCDAMALPVEDQVITIDEIRAAVASPAGSAGSVGRFGLYADRGDQYPGKLIRDFGVTDGTPALTVANAQVSQALGTPLVLQSGLWWMTFVTQGAPATNPTMKAYDQNFDPRIGSNDTGQLNTTTLDRSCYTTVASPVTGALPDPYPTDAVVLAAPYALLFRVSVVA